MNLVQRVLARFLLGDEKSLYDLHPELLDRQPIMRVYSDEERQNAGMQTAAQDYTAHVWLHKAVKIIADNVCSLPLQVVSGPESTIVERHPEGVLLAYVNESMSASDLWRQWVINMELGGESGLEFVRNGSRLAAVWPHTADETWVRVATEGRYSQVSGYRIEPGRGQPYDLQPAEFLHFKFYNPVSPWRGLAPVSAVRMGVLIDQLAQAWSKLFFDNSARPDGVVITPQGLTSKERGEIETKLQAKYGGLGNAHRFIVLEQGITDIKPLSWSPKDTEWLEQRKIAREEVGAIFGVPDEMMGWGKDTYENFRAAMTALWQMTLLPLINYRDEALTNWFVQYGQLTSEQRIKTDVSGVDVLQRDKGPKLDQAYKLFTMGYPVNLINDKLSLDLGEIEGGDVGYLPLSLVPVTSIPGTKKPEAVAPPAEPPKQIASPVNKALVEYGSPLHKQMWLLFKAKTEGRERGMIRLLKKEFQKQESALLPAVRADDWGYPPVSPDEWEALTEEAKQRILAELSGKLIDRAAMDAAWVEVFTAHASDTVQAGGDHGMEQLGASDGKALKVDIGIAFDLLNPAVQKWLKKMLHDFAEEIGDESQAQLEVTLRKGIAEGWAIPQLADEIANVYEGFKGSRAEKIARTEIIKAFNYGSYAAYKQAGVERKEWISALDSRTRTPPESEFDHVAAHGEIVKLDEDFQKTGEGLEFPGDPAGSAGNVIQCRCAIAPVVGED
jgi:HK97 family phage portal protein